MVIDFTVKNVLTEETIEKVAEEAIKLQNDDARTIVHQQHIRNLQELRKKIQNIVDAIADGFRTPAMKVQLENLTEEEENLAKIVAEESYQKPTFTKEQLVEWMSGFKNGDTKSPRFRKQIVDIFVNSIYLYDDHFTISYHTGERQDVMSYSSALEAESFEEGSNFQHLVDQMQIKSNHFVLKDGLFTFRVAL